MGTTTGAESDSWDSPAPTGPWAASPGAPPGTPPGAWGGPTTRPPRPAGRRLGRWRIPGAGLVVLLQGLRIGLRSSNTSIGATIAVLGGIDLFVLILLAASYFINRGSPKRLRFAQMGEVVAAVVLVSIVGLVTRSVLPARTDSRSIPGAPGYNTFGGPTGKPLLVGAPWGRPCQPIVLWVAPGMPSSVYSQIETTVLGARALGIDVTLNEPDNTLWEPAQLYPAGQNNSTVQFVWVYPHTNSPPKLSDGQPEHIGFGWDARSTPDGNNERLTSMDADLYLREVEGDPQKVDLAIRQLIAFAQGVGSTTDSGSGIARGTTLEEFSPGDLQAMQVMSGCNFSSAPVAPPFQFAS